MKILRNIDVLKKALKDNSELGFVPTMGGLHKGHISLIKESLNKSKKHWLVFMLIQNNLITKPILQIIQEIWIKI